MTRILNKTALIILLNVSTVAFGNDISCILKAYPDTFKTAAQVEAFYNQSSHDSAELDYKDNASYEYLLEHADLNAQMLMPYPMASLDSPPATNFDPGRIRSDSFFKYVYGKTEQEVLAHTELVYWGPCKCNIRFSSLNHAAESLRDVEKIISMDPVLSSYVRVPAGSYANRNIKGTNRKSVHAYAAAVDFNLPSGMSKYWIWSGCQNKTTCEYPKNVLSDRDLPRLVKVFEDHGFIWGGKWYHFDTVHFEYRPELIGPLRNSECKS